MDNRELIVAIWAGVTSIGLAYLTYRKSIKVDAVAAQASIGGESRAGTAQIIEGLNSLVDQLQEDNKDLREEARNLLIRIASLISESEDVRRRLMAFQRKYGDNGNGSN